MQRCHTKAHQSNNDNEFHKPNEVMLEDRLEDTRYMDLTL